MLALNNVYAVTTTMADIICVDVVVVLTLDRQRSTSFQSPTDKHWVFVSNSEMPQQYTNRSIAYTFCIVQATLSDPDSNRVVYHLSVETDSD